MARKFLSYSVAVDSELHSKVTEIAKSQGLSFSNWVRMQLIKAIDEKSA